MGVYIPREDVDRAGKIGLYEYFRMTSPNVISAMLITTLCV